MPSSATFVSRQKAGRKFSPPAGFRKQANLSSRSDHDRLYAESIKSPGKFWSRQDKDGCFWIVGRIDDVLNVSGHRIGTAEIECALVSHPAVAEAAAVGRPDELKGQSLVVFVTLKSTHTASDQMKEDLRTHVGKEIGSLAKPDQVRFAAALPKTYSGKIMRRLLRELATSGEIKGDTTTREDFSVISSLKSGEE